MFKAGKVSLWMQIIHRKIARTLLFCTDSANIFINPRPACPETEKGWEGERDTGTTSGKGVTRHVAWGYLRTYTLDRWRGAGESSPLHIPLPLLDGLRMQRQISRIASNLEGVNMITDIRQQQWLFTFFRFSDRTPISRDRDCCELTEISRIPGGRLIFGCRVDLDYFWAWWAVTSSRYSTRESPPIKAGHWGTIPHSETTCTRFNT